MFAYFSSYLNNFRFVPSWPQLSSIKETAKYVLFLFQRYEFRRSGFDIFFCSKSYLLTLILLTFCFGHLHFRHFAFDLVLLYLNEVNVQLSKSY